MRRSWIALALATATSLALLLAPAALAVPRGSTVLLDRPSGFGALPFSGNDDAFSPRHSLSANGCFVVFTSEADDLLSTDQNSAENVYRQNRCASGTAPVQVNKTATGEPAEAGSFNFSPTISADGRYVAFATGAKNLEPTASDNHMQVMVKDMNTGALTFASRGNGPDGGPAVYAFEAVISGDGSAVAFATDGVLDGENADGVAQDSDIYIRLLAQNKTRMVSVTSTGARGGARGYFDISYDGKNVAFVSGEKLDPGDTDSGDDVYLRRGIGTAAEATRLVSFSGGGQTAGADGGNNVAISGNLVAYTSDGAWVSACPDACNAATRVDMPLTGGDNTGSDFDPFFPQTSGAAPTQVLWSTRSPLDPSDTDGSADVYRAPLSGGAVSLVTGGVSGGVFGADSTESGSLVVFSSDAPGLPGTGGAATQVFEKNGAQLRNLLQDAGLPVRDKQSGEGEIGRLHAVSADGRLVVFRTDAAGMGAPFLPDSGRHVDQVAVRDVVSGATTLVSVAPDGKPQNDASRSDFHEAGMNAAGTRVVFGSRATNLVPGVPAGKEHVYLRDLAAGTTRLIDRNAAGNPTAGGADAPQISGDGSKVVFRSDSTDLPGANGNDHVYEVNLASGAMTLLDVAANGDPANGSASEADPDFDGGRVAFASQASNLGGATPPGADVYVRDLATGKTTLASVQDAPSGTQRFFVEPSISGDGTRVAFTERGLGSDVDRAYVRDMTAGTTVAASTTATSEQRVGQPSISTDGTRIAFRQQQGIFVRKLGESAQTRVDLADDTDAPGHLGAFEVSLSGNGECAAFASQSDDLVRPSYGPDDSHVYLRAVGGSCPGAAPSTPDTRAPVISGAHAVPKRFAVAGGRTARSAGAAGSVAEPAQAAAKRKRVHRGTRFVFKLSEAARTRISIARRARAAHGHRRFTKVVTLTRSKTRKGKNRIAFSGRVGKRALGPGVYQATLVATDRAGNRSRPKHLTFTIVRG
jgi:Tol biopolymer transport system component